MTERGCEGRVRRTVIGASHVRSLPMRELGRSVVFDMLGIEEDVWPWLSCSIRPADEGS